MTKKIPEHAKKVFSGVLFDVYQREQKLFNGKYTTFEAIKRKNGVVMIPITKEGKIILIKDSQPMRNDKIQFPSGSIEDLEAEIDGVKREFLEETGYKAENIEFLFYEDSPRQKFDFQIHYFIGIGCEKIAEQNLEGGEKIEIIENTFEEFEEMLKNPIFDKHLKYVLEKNDIIKKIEILCKKKT